MRLFRLFVTGALALTGGMPATAASMTNSHVSNAQGQTGSLIPGQLVSVSGAGDLAEAVTDWGVNRVYTTGTSLSDEPSADSLWSVQFTLTGGNPGDFVALDIGYSFHGILGPLQGDFSFVQFRPCFGAGPYDCSFVNPTERSTGFRNGLGDVCSLFNNPAVQSPNQGTFGACQGTYDFQGTIHTTNSFRVGQFNFLSGELTSEAIAGTADAFSTSQIRSITVPTGIGWSYQDGITGNPLNFQNVSATPEPGTFVYLGLGLAGLMLRRFADCRRHRKLTPCPWRD